MKNEINTTNLLNVALKAAIRAGREILAVYNSPDSGLEYKPDQSPLTIADKRAHRTIEELLDPTGIPLLSEEGTIADYEIRKKWSHFWLADPLDGTKEFLNKNGEFTVNIALIEKQLPIAGVVYAPVTNYIYWGSTEGSFRAKVAQNEVLNESIRKLPLGTIRKTFVVVASRSHRTSETETFIQSLETGGMPLEIKSKGSSLKICLVAEGSADIYPRLAPTMEWDTAAGHAVAKFAGKTLFQFQSKKPLVYNKENLLNPWFVVA